MSNTIKEFFEKDRYIDDLEGLIKYQYAYDIFMEHWESLPDEEKPKIHEKLKELGL